MVEEDERLKPPVDPFGRTITHLRMSVTERCNLDCPYCHREGMPSELGEEASSDVFGEILCAAARLGIQKSLKITGGEPLLRDDLEKIIETAKDVGFADISLTTNGTLLTIKRALSLKKAGLMRINIGCDAVSSSLLQKTYEKVKGALEAASAAALAPIKLNMVVLKGLNENEVERMLEVARSFNATLQLIELIRTEDEDFYRRYHIDLNDWEKKFADAAVRVEVRRLQNRTVYRLENGGIVEFIRPTHNASFCSSCSKLRITSDGRIKTCLMRNDDITEFKGKKSILEAISRRRPFYG